MPQSPSADKRMRSNARKELRNQRVASAIHTAKKTFRATLATDKAKAQELGFNLISMIDKAASKGIIPKGRANRVKSRVNAHLGKLNVRSSK